MHNRLQDTAPTNSIPNTVADLWLPNTKQWDTHKIQLVFGINSVHDFNQVQIINHNHDDYLCWESSTSGSCTAKDAYLALLTQLPPSTTNQGSRALPQPILVILTKVWKHKYLQPRYKTFAWRLLRQALATAKRASRFSQNIDNKCAYCGRVEDDNHLFFSCDFSRAVWFAGTPSIRTDQLPQGNQGVQQEVSYLFSNNISLQEIQRIFTTLWYIWKARNDLRFNNKSWKVSSILHAVQADIHTTNSYIADHNTQQILPQIPNLQINSVNTPTNIHTMSTGAENLSNHRITNLPQITTHGFFAGTKCYIDAAITPHIQRYFARQAGLGILIEGQDHPLYRNIFIQAITDGALDPLQAETHAMVLAAKIISNLQTERVHYFTDASILATNLQKQDPVTEAADWRNRPLLAEFLLASQQSSYRVSKLPRSRNATAHTLAAQARTQAETSACRFICNNPNHNSCVVQTALQNLSWGASRLISVSCL
ncbi:unnamed protein product [Urochloa humidicola]